MAPRARARGFSIAEVLIALAIALVIQLALGQFYLSARAFYAQSSAQAALQRQGGVVLDIMSDRIRHASGVTVTTCDGVADSLVVITDEGAFCYARRADPSTTPPIPDQLLESGPAGGARNLLAGALTPVTLTAFTVSATGRQVIIGLALASGPGTEPMTFRTGVLRRN